MWDIKEAVHISCPYCDGERNLWCDDIDHEPFFDDFMVGYVLCEDCDKEFKVYFSVTEIEWKVNDE